MASSAHAFFCFEVLSASFERRDPPKLERVIELYDRYESDTATNGGAIRDGQGEAEEEEDNDPEAGDSEEEDDEEEPHDEPQRRDRHTTLKSGPQLSSISRLKASTSSSR